MTDVERALLDALRDLEHEVADAAQLGRRPEVVTRVLRLRELTSALPLQADPMLMHCLQRQSWEKAPTATSCPSVTWWLTMTNRDTHARQEMTLPI